jgi:hypothetical protein
MTRHLKAEQKELDALESEFKPLLLACLHASARGRLNLFGQFDRFPDNETRWIRWPEAARLKEVAYRIRSIRSSFGAPNEVCERILYLCSLRGPNTPCEVKLARMLLDEITPASGPRS